MSKDELKDAKNRLKKEDKKKNKTEIKYIASLIRAMREGGGGGNTGGNTGGSDDDICEEGMTKKELKTELKKLKRKKKTLTGGKKVEVTRQIKICKALRDGEGFENYVNGENEDEDLNVVEKKLSNSCRKVVVDPDTTNISGADLGGDLFDLADFEKKVIV